MHTPRQRIDAKVMATSRLYENLATLLPNARDHIREMRDRADGHAINVTEGRAHRPWDKATRPPAIPAGDCTANVPDPDDPTTLIDCGHERPCPDHDHPVKLTSTEQAAEARIQLARLEGDLDDQLALAATIAHQAIATVHRIIGMHTNPGDPPICIHLEGCHELAGYDMTNNGPVMRKSRLCDTHELERLDNEAMERAAVNRRRMAAHRTAGRYA